jgi:putative addiction module component (TIGR02574 family)
MTLNKEQVMTEAMKLDPLERESLAEELLLSVHESDRAEIDAAWLAEAKRREAAFEAGQASAKPVDNVIQRLLSKARA